MLVQKLKAWFQQQIAVDAAATPTAAAASGGAGAEGAAGGARGETAAPRGGERQLRERPVDHDAEEAAEVAEMAAQQVGPGTDVIC